MGNKFKLHRITLILAVFLLVVGIFGWVYPPQISEASALAQEGWFPTATYTPTPTDGPTSTPTDGPTSTPTDGPTSTPTDGPTSTPTDGPTSTPTDGPTSTPTDGPTSTPTDGPTSTPTSTPTDGPTSTPTPTGTATTEPTGTIVEVVGPTEVSEGDTFLVEVVASNMPEPGIFGFQFQLNWDDTVFSLVDGTAALNSDFSVVAIFDINPASIQTGASREGDVTDLTGPLTLLSAKFQANVVTDPDTSSLTLSGVKLGRKGGIDVPVDQVIDLDVTVVAATDGDIKGKVKVQGRADNNQAGHSVQDEVDLATLTDANGDFSFADAEFGLYTLTANSAGFLAAICTDVDHNSQSTVLENITLLAGDIDDSREIDIIDAVAIGMVFGSTEPDEVADLNLDVIVDVLDLILMSANFGQTSATNPWICQL